jgi:hypothetical protein
MERLHLPLGGWHGAGGFIGKIDAGFGAESDSVSPVRDFVDAKARSECVEEDVAGLVDGFVDVDRAVAAMDPAALIGAEEVYAAGTVDGHVLSNAFLKAGKGHDDFESRTRGELRLNGFVHQGVVGIGDVLVPFVTADAHREGIGIECGTTDEGQHFSGVGIDSDHGAIAVAQSVFGGALDVEIDSEAEALSRFSGLGAEAANLAAMAIHDDVFGAVLAAQDAIVRGFNSGTADDVAGLIHGVTRVVQHFFADLADVADEMSGETVAGIEAALLLDGVEFG